MDVRGQDQGEGAVEAPRARVVRKRRRAAVVARSHQVAPRFSDEEFAVLGVAASAAGLTVTGYVASRAVAVARGEVAPLPASTGDVVRELVEQRTLLRRYVSLLNQVVAKLNATGASDGSLGAVIERCDALVGQIGGAVVRVGRR